MRDIIGGVVLGILGLVAAFVGLFLIQWFLFM